jgi:hypothetical protein
MWSHEPIRHVRRIEVDTLTARLARKQELRKALMGPQMIIRGNIARIGVTCEDVPQGVQGAGEASDQLKRETR